MYNGSYTAERFSSLNQITADNVKSLVEVGRCELPETTSFQSGPIMVNETLYVTTATSTYAMDARTGMLRWSHTYPTKSLGIGTPVRAVAYADGRLFRGTPDAHVIALDARTGQVLWDVAGGDPAKGEYFVAAAIVWQGRVYIGTAGSDIAGIGRMMAFDARDGTRLWNFDIVPATGPAAATWSSDPTHPKAGGGTWSSYALDTTTGTLYISTGNPGPDFVGDYRPGDNLYTCSVVMLNAKTGEFLRYYQVVPHDVHDWDVAASPILFTSRAGRDLVAIAGKNGYLYGLSRDLKTLYFKVPVTTISNEDAPLTSEGTRFLPGTQGGVEWNGPAYSPELNALFVNAVDWATIIKLGSSESLTYTPGKVFLGSANGFGDSDKERSGWLTAVDADSGRVLWKYHAPQPLLAAVTPTASGLLFTGDLEGNFLAFDAAKGEILFKKDVGGPVGGGVVTYMLAGKQYIAVAAGMNNPIMKTKSGPARVAIFALP
jgi:alcohol dehydrogenase (cytochrome c)